MSSIVIFCYIVSVLLVLVASLHVYMSWNYDYWRKRSVPHNPPSPFVGSITFLMRQSATEWFRDQYRQFSGEDYFGIWVFRRPGLVVRSPELARRIMVKDFVYFRDRYLSAGKNDPLGSLNIFTLNDPLWSSIRRRLTPVFTSAKLRNLMKVINYYSKDVVNRIRIEHVDGDEPTDLRDLFACFTTDVIGAVSFGIHEHSVRSHNSALRTITRETSKYTLRRGIEFSSIFFYPSLTDVFRFKFWTKEMSEFFKRVFWKIADERSREKTTRNKDLLDALIAIRNETQIAGSKKLTDDAIVAQAAIFVQGGFDTSAVTLTFFFYELAYNPLIQQRLYQELISANPLNDGKVDYSIVKDLAYLTMCLKELLRKYPSMGFLDRVADKDYKVDNKLTIKKGTPVYINAVGMHYDETYFADPTKFDPERFNTENEAKIVPFCYLPFGEGPRNCIGMRFAIQSVKTLITHIMLNYEVRPKPGYPSPNELPFDSKGVFLGPGATIDIKFLARN